MHTRRRKAEHYCPQYKLRKVSHLWTNSIDVARRFILAGAGNPLQMLIVASGMYKDGPDGEHLVHEFARNCPHMTSLSIVDTGFFWVNKFGKQLDNLEVQASIALDFPFRSTNLRELTLDSITYSYNLKATGLWRKMLSGLETLVIFGTISARSEVDEIKKYCLSIKNISLKGHCYEDIVSIATLLASYGGQLEYAYLHRMQREELKTVAGACPKASFYFDVWLISDLFVVLKMLGPQIDVITTFLLDYEHIED